MSREILTALSFHKDFMGFDYTGYSSNVYPRDVFKGTQRAKDKTALEYIKSFVRDIIWNSLELPKSHKLNLYVRLLHLNTTEVSLYDKNMHDKWENGKDDEIIWKCEDSKKRFEDSKKEFDDSIENVAKAFMNNSLDSKIKKMKSTKLVMTNGYIYITKYTKKGYWYSSDKENAKVFNEIQALSIPKFLKDKFEIKEV